MTVNFEHTDYLESIHPSVSVFVKYSVMADVERGVETITSIRSKVCTLRGELEWETLDIPTFGNNKERNKLLALFTELAIQKHDEEIKRRENEGKEVNSDNSLLFERIFKSVKKHENARKIEDEQWNKTA
jgi:hypothetical protein